ncbi:MAG TPA: sigma-70 family RNA polymerase sigma factor [Candidatus Dormibacteraeota bacterium]|nr:sigma-70 family RNA polymerase sigma factor [Candidatus Dormibacteraeota bacterium]
MVATLSSPETLTAGRTLTAEQLCHAYAADVCRFAALMTRNPADAEDLAQEALLRAIRSLRSFDASRGSAAGWLWRIVANAARDAATRRQRLADLVVRAALLTPRESASVEDLALANVGDAALHRLLAALPLRDRTLLALRYGAGLETREVGEALGLSPDSTSKAIRRALARLRARLEETAR